MLLIKLELTGSQLSVALLEKDTETGIVSELDSDCVWLNDLIDERARAIVERSC